MRSRCDLGTRVSPVQVGRSDGPQTAYAALSGAAWNHAMFRAVFRTASGKASCALANLPSENGKVDAGFDSGDVGPMVGSTKVSA